MAAVSSPSAGLMTSAPPRFRNAASASRESPRQPETNSTSARASAISATEMRRAATPSSACAARSHVRAVASSSGPAMATCNAPRTSASACRVSSPGNRSSASAALIGTMPSRGNFTGITASVSLHGAISTVCDSRLSPASAKSVVRRGSAEKLRTRQTSRASCPATGRAGSSARPARPTFAASSLPTATRVRRMPDGVSRFTPRHAERWKSESTTSSRSPSAVASCFSASASAPAMSPGSGRAVALRSASRRKSRFGPGSGSSLAACARTHTMFAREFDGSVASTSSAAAAACASRVCVPSA